MLKNTAGLVVLRSRRKNENELKWIFFAFLRSDINSIKTQSLFPQEHRVRALSLKCNGLFYCFGLVLKGVEIIPRTML